MELSLEKYSYRGGEGLLNSNPVIKQEIEDTLLEPKAYIHKLSYDEYLEIVRCSFMLKGWENEPSILNKHGKRRALMDFRKENVGIQFGSPRNSLQSELPKFQTASQHPKTHVNLGIYLTMTSSGQRYLVHESCKSWACPTSHVVAKSLPSISRLVQLPLCVIGLDMVDVPVQTIDLQVTPVHVIKELVLAFLEEKYNSRIEKKVRVMGKQSLLELDGVMHLNDKDVVLSIEISESATSLPSRLLADGITDQIDMMREYQKITRPEVCLRFILMGPFDSSFIDGVFGSGGVACGWAADMEIEYEAHSWEEFESFLARKRESLLSTGNL